MNSSLRSLLLAAFIPASLCSLQAAFVKIEDFESHPIGQTVGGTNSWVSNGDNTTTPVVPDPADASNRVLAVQNKTNAAVRLNTAGVTIANNTTTTLFLRFRFAGEKNYSFGMSDVAAAGAFGDFESQMNQNNADNAIRIRDTTVFDPLSPASPLAEETWHNIWMVINNATDRTTVYLDKVTAPGATTNALQTNGAQSVFTFRNSGAGVVANNLVTFLIVTGGGGGGDQGHFGTLLIDDIWIDKAGQNLTNPRIPSVPYLTASPDFIEVGIDGAIGFDPTVNDTTNSGTIDHATLQIVNPPAAGAVSFDAITQKLIYRHTGAGAGADTFRYRVTSTGGASGEAQVNVNISNAMRLANVTSAMPATPPPGGALQLVDAMPGLTFQTAVAMTPVPGSPQRMIVASINGSVWMVPDTAVANPVKKEILNVLSLCPSPLTRGRAIYSVVCHPNFDNADPTQPGAGKVIITYQGKPDGWQVSPPFPNTGAASNLLNDNDISCTLRVASFTFTPAQLDTLLTSTNSTTLATTREAVLATEVRYTNLAEEALYHSINDCHFGPDGYLYVSFGDEGEQGEPYLNAQYITKDQFSSIIRIDIDKKEGNLEPNPHYAIPTDGNGNAYFSVPLDNPYVGWPMSYNGAAIPLADRYKVRTEIYATGFRNPFKFSVDMPTGDLWVGDVGMDLWEEVSRIQKGDNAGWSFWEGNHERTNIAHRIPVANPKFPEVEYGHGSDGNSVTGGLLYRGGAYPTTELHGRYIFGDFGSGKVWTLVPGTSTKVPLSAGGLSSIVDFEVDAATDEILLLQHGSNGKIMRLRESPPISGSFPQLLSDTGAFADLATLTPNPGVVPYEPNLTFWSDHADKSRFFMIKNLTDQMGYSATADWTFPEGMIFVKHFDMDLNRDQPGTNVKRLETRFLVRNSGGIYGVAYQWNASGTNATLVPAGGSDFDLAITEGGVTKNQRWHIPTRAECMSCHNSAANHILSPTAQQLNRIGQLGSGSGNMLTLLSQSGYLAGMTDNPATLPRTSRPEENGVSLDERVRSYLTVNCTYCHRDQGGANQTWGVNGREALEQMGIFYGVPVSESYHDENDRHIIPGNKSDSLIWNRIQARYAIGDGTYHGYSQMPPLATNVTDAAGIQLLSQWIDTFANVAPKVDAAAPVSTAMMENSAVGSNVASIPATDPDVRGGTADNDLLTYAITSGNAGGLFSINSVTGTLSVNGVLDYETAAQHVIEITATDNFAANPKSTTHTLTVQVLDVANEDDNNNGIPDWWETPFALPLTAGGDFDRDGVQDYFEYVSGSDPGNADIHASLGLRMAAHTGAGIALTWRSRNGLFLNRHYFFRSAATPGGPWTVLLPADYEILSSAPAGIGFSDMTIFVPGGETSSFFRLTQDAE